MSNETVYNAPPAPAPVPPPAPTQPPQKVRRVGTLTMGLSLMATGTAAIYSLFNPAFDLLTAFRFAPVVLIFLGLEILAFAIVGNARLKYDFLSIVVCALLIGITFCLSVIPYASTYWGPQRSYTEHRLKGELNDLCYQELGNDSDVLSVAVSLDLRTRAADESLTVSSLVSGDWVTCTVQLKDNYPSSAAFAQSCRTVLDKLSRIGVDFDNVTITSDGNTYYELNADGRYRQSMTADKLEQLVFSSVRYDDTMPDDEPDESSQEQEVSSEDTTVLSEPKTPDKPDTPSAPSA